MFTVRIPWKLLLSSLFITLSLSMPRIVHAAAVAQTQEASDERVRIMVKVDPAVRDEARNATFSAMGSVDRTLSQVGWEVIETDATAAPEVIAELQANLDILEVTPDYPLELTWTPNDPAYGQGSQWSLDKIGADVAWEFSTGQTITVAVIDSGIDPNHPDLVGRTVPGYNFIGKNTDTTDLCGHGTHVAGIVAAEADNAAGMVGVAPKAVIMPLKVISDNCLGNYSRLMQAILYAVDQGVRIISITSGGTFNHSGLHDAIIYARNQGVLVVIAAGNRGNDLPFYPGSFEEAFTVAGTDQDDNQYKMSNFGTQIDLAAPAVSIYSTYYDSVKGSTYASLTGTSMAAPHVAGVAALILAIDPKLSLADLENSLTGSASDLGAPGWDPIFGRGRVTAWRAVAAISPVAGNIRLGHYRVPKMADFLLTEITATANAESIVVSWVGAPITKEHSIVIYRSRFPVFEAAEDIIEVETTASGIYTDTTVEADQEYYYWLVDTDHDVEVATTGMLNAKLTTALLSPQEPEQGSPIALFIPFVNR